MPEPLYRAKVYRTYQMGYKPKVRIPVQFGPWVEEEKRAQNLVNLLSKSNSDTWLQIARGIAS